MNAELYNILVHLHSVGRWIVLLLLLIAIFNSLVAGQRPFIKSDARTGTVLVIFTDLMLLIGIALYFFGPRGYNVLKGSSMGEVMKEPFSRFFTVEHTLGMLIAIILIHIGKAQARKQISDKAKHKRTLIFYLLALLIILASIPWPFRQVGAGSHWF
jgi:L-asparagine transporter-like permease